MAVEDLGKKSIIIDRRRLGVSQADSHLENVLSFLGERAAEMDDERKIAFAHAISDVGYKFWNVAGNLETSKSPGEKSLTDAAICFTSEAVKPQLPSLLDQLRKATAEPGMKTALAKFLGAPLASVSRWLSEDREPGGEIVLQMQAWLKLPNR